MSSSRLTGLVRRDIMPLDSTAGGEIVSLELPLIKDTSVMLYLRWQRNNRSLIRVPTQTRSKVTCSDRKLRRQKGSGRARLGDASSPMLRGGAVAHGPKPLRRRLKMNVKDRRRTVLGVLARLIDDGRVSYLPDGRIFKGTGELADWLLPLVGKGERLLYLTLKDKDDLLAWRNLANVKFIPYKAINVLDLLTHGRILIDIGAIPDGLILKIPDTNEV